MSLELVPMTLKEANAFVEQHHRHHGKVTGHKFSIGASDGEKIVGVAIVGRPVSRYVDDGWTLEVNRLCTDGSKNACSMLYAAAWRAARAMAILCTEKQRRALYLYYGRGLTLEEISGLLGVEPSSVSRRIQKGIGHVKQAIKLVEGEV